MKRHISLPTAFPAAADGRHMVTLLLLCAVGSCAGLAGSFSDAGLAAAQQLSADALQQAVVSENGVLSLFRAAVLYFRFPALLLLCSSGIFGGILLPLLLLLHFAGLGFAAACLMMADVTHPFLTTLTVLGVRCVFTFPVILLLSAGGSAAFPHKDTAGKGLCAPALRRICLISGIYLLPGVFLEYFLVPYVLQKLL